MMKKNCPGFYDENFQACAEICHHVCVFLSNRLHTLQKEDAYTLTRLALAGMEVSTSGIMQSGCAFHLLLQGKKYRQYATGIKTVEEYCNHIGISRGTFYHHVEIYRKFGLLFEKHPFQLDVKKLLALIPTIPDDMPEEEKLTIITEAKQHPMQEFHNRVRELRGEDPCYHTETYTIVKCKSCGAIISVIGRDE